MALREAGKALRAVSSTRAVLCVGDRQAGGRRTEGGGLCHSWGRCLQGRSFCEAELSAFTVLHLTPFHPLTGLRPMFPSSVCV